LAAVRLALRSSDGERRRQTQQSIATPPILIVADVFARRADLDEMVDVQILRYLNVKA